MIPPRSKRKAKRNDKHNGSLWLSLVRPLSLSLVRSGSLSLSGFDHKGLALALQVKLCTFIAEEDDYDKFNGDDVHHDEHENGGEVVQWSRCVPLE